MPVCMYVYIYIYIYIMRLLSVPDIAAVRAASMMSA